MQIKQQRETRGERVGETYKNNNKRKGIQDEYAKIMGKHNRQLGANNSSTSPSLSAHATPPLPIRSQQKNCSNILLFLFCCSAAAANKTLCIEEAAAAEKEKKENRKRKSLKKQRKTLYKQQQQQKCD